MNDQLRIMEIIDRPSLPPPSSVNAIARAALVKRTTLETDVTVSLNLDGVGTCKASTGIPFLDHMLHQIASHGLIDLDVQAIGDLEIDDHHTNEDVGITLGQALAKAVGDRSGISRFGHFIAPLDEALIEVVLDFSGRPSLELPFADSQPTDRHLRYRISERVFFGGGEPHSNDAAYSAVAGGKFSSHCGSGV